MDFSAIKTEYETTKTSFKKLSSKHGVHYKQIERAAKKEEWVKFNPKKPTKVPQTPKPHQEENTHDSSLDYLRVNNDGLREEIEMMEDDLLNHTVTMEDTTIVESYMLSYKLFRLYQEEISFQNISETPYVTLQQIQIQQNNLHRLGKEIADMKRRYKNE